MLRSYPLSLNCMQQRKELSSISKTWSRSILAIYTLENSSTSATNLYIARGYEIAFTTYFLIGTYLSFMFAIVIMYNLQSIVPKLSKITIHQINVWKTLCLVAVITMLIELIFEFVWSIIWSTHTDSVSAIAIWSYLFLKFIPLAVLFILSLVCCCKSGFNSMLVIVLLMLAVMAYWFALPTFLFLLVYPINVVAVFAYMAAFTFTLIVSITAACSGSGHTKCSCSMRIFHNCALVWNILVLLIYLFVVLVTILYVIAIGKTSVISFSFYGVLSLLPSVAITAVSWMLKNKLFKEDDKGNEPGRQDNGPGTDSELQPLNTQHTDISDTDVRQRTNYQTTGEQPPQDP